MFSSASPRFQITVVPQTDRLQFSALGKLTKFSLKERVTNHKNHRKWVTNHLKHRKWTSIFCFRKFIALNAPSTGNIGRLLAIGDQNESVPAFQIEKLISGMAHLHPTK